MTVLTIACSLLALAYCGLMILYRIGWKRMPLKIAPANFTPKTSISIIIPARNEAANITACIQSILDNNYPKHLFEIIVVDDHSEDATAALVVAFNAPNVYSIELKKVIPDTEIITSHKKKALSTGIAKAVGELIITTDADCIASENWLREIAGLYEQENAVMIAGPVDFTTNNSIVQQFQSIDFMMMQGITVAAHQLRLGNMANGANLAFKRAAFQAVNGYEGIDHLASGDDYLLLVKMKENYPCDIHFLKSKDAIIRTLPQPTWNDFLQQRIRWASKSGKYPDRRLTAILMTVYLFNVSLFLLCFAACFNAVLWIFLTAIIILKIVAESIVMIPVSKFFNKQNQFASFVLLQPMHIAYIILAGFLGMVGKYNWKGRETR